jgi:hypothetical protein
MPKFEVHIPANDPGGFNMTLKVGADNWMAALKAGMQKLGEQGTVSQNVMVDIQDDNSIHVTEAHSGRVFRIRELTDEEAARAQVKRPSGLKPVPPRSEARLDPDAMKRTVLMSPAVAPTVSPARPEPKAPGPAFDASKTVPGYPSPGLETPTPVPTPAPIAAPKPAPIAAPKPVPAPRPSGPTSHRPPVAADRPTLPPTAAQVAIAASVVEHRDSQPAPYVERPSGLHRPKSSPRIEVPDVEELLQPIKPVTRSIGRPKTSPNLGAMQHVSAEEMLADVFLRVVELDRLQSVEEAMEFILDLALEKVPCESGSVFRADGTTGDLSFMAARGPKARELLESNITIPAGTGIAGFCAVEGVSVAVNDVEKDPRHYSAISAQVKYSPKSMLCAPMMTHGRSFGCVQLINRRESPQFQEYEVGVLAYLAHQAALFLNVRLLE